MESIEWDPDLDLRGFNLEDACEEAKCFLSSFLSDKKFEVVYIITGRGSCSKKPVIKPAIIDILNNNKFPFNEVSDSGTLKIYPRITNNQNLGRYDADQELNLSSMVDYIYSTKDVGEATEAFLSKVLFDKCFEMVRITIGQRFLSYYTDSIVVFKSAIIHVLNMWGFPYTHDMECMEFNVFMASIRGTNSKVECNEWGQELDLSKFQFGEACGETKCFLSDFWNITKYQCVYIITGGGSKNTKTAVIKSAVIGILNRWRFPYNEICDGGALKIYLPVIDNSNSDMDIDECDQKLDLIGFQFDEGCDKAECFLSNFLSYENFEFVCIKVKNSEQFDSDIITKDDIIDILNLWKFPYHEIADNETLKVYSINNRNSNSKLEANEEKQELDLRGFHLEEACDKAKCFLSNFLYNNKYKFVYIITGGGSENSGRKPVIKPAVIDILNRWRFPFNEISDERTLKVYPVTTIEFDSDSDSNESEQEIDLRGYDRDEACYKTECLLSEFLLNRIHGSNCFIIHGESNISGESPIIKPAITDILNLWRFPYNEDTVDEKFIIYHAITDGINPKVEINTWDQELDLRGFQLEEACHEVKCFLSDFLYFRKYKIVYVITGGGSKNNRRAVIKPAIVDILNRWNFPYNEICDGGTLKICSPVLNNSEIDVDESDQELGLIGSHLDDVCDKTECFLSFFLINKNFDYVFIQIGEDSEQSEFSGEDSTIKPAITDILNLWRFPYNEDTGDKKFIIYRPVNDGINRKLEINTWEQELDLRGFQLEEACDEVKCFLSDFLYFRKYKIVYVITGGGSKNNRRAVIKPAVVDILNRWNFPYNEICDGGTLKICSPVLNTSEIDMDESDQELDLIGFHLDDACDKTECFLSFFLINKKFDYVFIQIGEDSEQSEFSGEDSTIKPAITDILNLWRFPYNEDIDDDKFIIYRPVNDGINRKVEINTWEQELDLRGFQLEEACDEVKCFLSDFLYFRKYKIIYVITGGGSKNNRRAVIKPAVVDILNRWNFPYNQICDGGTLKISPHAFNNSNSVK